MSSPRHASVSLLSQPTCNIQHMPYIHSQQQQGHTHTSIVITSFSFSFSFSLSFSLSFFPASDNGAPDAGCPADEEAAGSADVDDESCFGSVEEEVAGSEAVEVSAPATSSARTKRATEASPPVDRRASLLRAGIVRTKII